MPKLDPDAETQLLKPKVPADPFYSAPTAELTNAAMKYRNVVSPVADRPRLTTGRVVLLVLVIVLAAVGAFLAWRMR